ncbi:ABC-type glutathione transport system ATPase component [Actinoplanes lutulentus]|uniref:ABC transporter family protein n=1 Tax=Actinoplanes lutulentus TaxID=1287878 RepID=A0A327Z6Z2_9ACTN|nr:ATP-binding cassette domain-containing protein [Actinoplanes lutulentus]MBB2946296.1 ABC-type glutathione transport system ATPase component [Actinoplanes lutulentus]RAK28765.1 ABC transporter family protein [Actinoplanes lutulentus]
MSDALQVRDLRKVFSGSGGDFVAVEGISFDLPSGGSLALVGESGSGKTTTARMIAGLEQPTAGSVLVHGVNRPRLPWPRRQRRVLARQVQMVFQDPNSSLDPAQTVAASLDEVLRIHFDRDAAWRADRIRDLLAHVGLQERHVSVHPRRLSGGERQRVAIARALAVEPTVLVLDEAVSALDVSVQAHVLNLLTDLREELGLTYLFVSHDLAVVRQIADECVVMCDGHVEETGPIEAILEDPRSDYTRQLLAAIPRPGWTPTARVASKPGPAAPLTTSES